VIPSQGREERKKRGKVRRPSNLEKNLEQKKILLGRRIKLDSAQMSSKQSQ
jgi:hypothetical protein